MKDNIMKLNNEQKIDFLKKFYENLTDEEFKARLSVAGFEIIENIAGEILFEEEFELDAKITVLQYNFLIDEDLMELNCYLGAA